MAETILACVLYGEDGREVVARAVELTGALHAKLHVLIYDTRSQEHEDDYLLDVSMCRQLVADVDGRLRHTRGPVNRVVPTIAAVAAEVGATQVLIGHHRQSAMTRIFGLPIVEAILKSVPTADVHITRRSTRSADYEYEYEPAVAARLVDGKDGRRTLLLEPGTGGVAGWFIRELDTDFDTGFFVYEEDDRTREIRIRDGYVEP